MTIRPEQPEPFLRGCVFPAVTDAPYPRADPANADYLPADVWDAAQLPVGVRLEFEGDARTIRVWYRTTRASLGYRGEAAGCSFVAYRAGQKVAIQEAVMGEGMAELVMAGRPDLPVTVYLPEGMRPVVTAVAGVEEPITPAPLQPRWLAYGDAVTQGWLASAPAMAWPAVAGRKLGLDVCNLGYAGTARGEMTTALMLAETPAEVISIAFGMNNWSRVPYTTSLISEEVRCFLSVVRQGHPETLIVVVSPTARPDAEETPNRVGATLAELRSALEQAVLGRIGEGDEKLFLVAGLGVVDAEDLEDGIYPGDEGHRRLAAAVSKVLVPHLTDLQTRAEKRWAAEGTPSTPVAVESSPGAADRPAAATPTASRPGATGSAAGSAPVDPDGAGVDGTDPSTALFALDDLDSRDRRDRRLLDDAMLDALSPEVSLANGATANGVVAKGAAAKGAAANGAAANGGSSENSAVDGPSRNGSRHDGAEPPVSANHVVGDAMVGATVDTAPVDRGPAETGPADTALSDTESGSGAGDTEPTNAAPVDPAPVGPVPLEAKKVPPRTTTPVDIEIADMVSAALALATNGVEDVVIEPDPTPTIELQWEQMGSMDDFSMDDSQWAGGEVDDSRWAEGGVPDEPQWADPATAGAAQWTDSGLDDQLQWEEAAPAGPSDEPRWTDAGAHHEQQWVDAGAVDEQQWGEPVPDGQLQWTESAPVGPETELQWSDAAPADELQWSDAAPADELQWSDAAPADELQWSDAAPADELQWSDAAPADELQWSELGGAGTSDELEWSVAEPGPY